MKFSSTAVGTFLLLAALSVDAFSPATSVSKNQKASRKSVLSNQNNLAFCSPSHHVSRRRQFAMSSTAATTDVETYEFTVRFVL